ncbi:MAG: hypothetical protein BWK76_06370 [Desulfobulbaceae bacterium A2]|nr:MAG: hypothetical protein BWK76_06370 [Desulfobulbaceae bacterium A2]
MKRGKRSTRPPAAYRRRSYRAQARAEGLVPSIVRVKETDLHIQAPVPVAEEARSQVLLLRAQIEDYIRRFPDFLTALTPLPADPQAPPLVRRMLEAGISAGVGPMAAVAGAIAEGVGRALFAAGVDELIVENGGDIFMARRSSCQVAIFAGRSPLSGRVGIGLTPELMPLGVCCSSATVGHSLSFGAADAVVVLASCTALADAVATRIGNEVLPARPERDSIGPALEVARGIAGIDGVVVVQGDKLGAWGQVELLRL